VPAVGLKEELHLNKAFACPEHEAILNVYLTGAQIRKWGSDFLRRFALTDVQFNLLMILKCQGQTEDLSQARLSEMMLVNRANITGLVDRLEKAGLVRRTGDPKDRRTNRIILTPKGKALINKVDPLYGKEMRRMMKGLTGRDIRELIRFCEKIRSNL
jgi:DNA-binding MarR family transcriptional regulator